MGETPLVNCGPRSYSLHSIQSTAIVFYCFLCKHLPLDTFNPLLQQAGEIDNLTVSLGQSTLVVLCRFHVGAGSPGVAPHHISRPSTFNVLLGSSWFDQPWFLSEGKLATVRIIPSSWGSQRTCTSTRITPLLRLTSILCLPLCRINKLGNTSLEDCCDPLYLWVIKTIFWRRCRGGIALLISSPGEYTPPLSLFYFILFCLVYFCLVYLCLVYFCLVLFSLYTQKSIKI